MKLRSRIQFFIATILFALCAIAGCSQTEPKVAKAPPKLTKADQIEFNRGVSLIEHSESAKAEPIFRKLVEKQPDFYGFHVNLARTLLDQGKITQALPEFKTVAKLNSDYTIALFDIGQCYQFLSDFENAEKYYQQFIEKAEPGPAVEDAKQRIATMKSDSSNSQTYQKGTYFSPVTVDGRWAESSMPVRVYIPGSKEPFYHPVYKELLKKAFLQWQDASNGKISFEFVDDREHADIECLWTVNARDARLHGERGVALVHATPTGFFTVQLVMLLDRAQIPNVELSLVALHECGHALGLAHSNKADDVMFAIFNPHALQTAKLSDRDKKSLLALYATPMRDFPKQDPKGTIAAAEKGIDELTGKISLKPTAGLYAERSVLYCTLKFYAKALSDIDQSLKLEPNTVAYHGGRATYLGFLGRYDEAVKECSKTMQMSKFDSDYYRNNLAVRASLYDMAGKAAEAKNDNDQLKKLRLHPAVN